MLSAEQLQPIAYAALATWVSYSALELAIRKLWPLPAAVHDSRWKAVLYLCNIAVGVYDVTTGAAEGNFDNTPFIGTLENGGLGLAPFHDFESKVSPDLAAELEEVTAGIIDGSIEVTSPASPGQ